MKVAARELEQHLAKKLAPIYLISGDEHLLVQEAMDTVRSAARKAGFAERVSLSPDSGTDWGKLLFQASHSLSLFSEKRIVELQLSGTKPNAEANKILKDIAAHPITDTLLLIATHKLDSKTEQTSWYKAIDKVGVAVPLWPIPPEQLPAWIMQRAKKANLHITTDAAALLADQVEGNLLAAANDIEKLCLLQINGVIDRPVIEKAIADNAHYDIFGLVDCALSGNHKRSLRILTTLQSESTEPLLVLWALMREVRTNAAMATQLKQGQTLQQVFSQHRVWEKRQAGVRRFLQLHTEQHCWDFLSQGAKIDRIIKGATPGNPWAALQHLTLQLAGNAIIKS